MLTRAAKLSELPCHTGQVSTEAILARLISLLSANNRILTYLAFCVTLVAQIAMAARVSSGSPTLAIFARLAWEAFTAAARTLGRALTSSRVH